MSHMTSAGMRRVPYMVMLQFDLGKPTGSVSEQSTHDVD